MNIKNLMRKELKLVLYPAVLLFALFGAMLLIPAYPFSVETIYFFFTIQICFQVAKENKDLEFTMLLPVSRKEIVIAKHLHIVFVQAVFLVVTAVFAMLSAFVVMKGGNTLSLDGNFTFFGIVLVGYSLFNLIFFPMHFKTCKALAKPLIFAILAFIVWIVSAEILIAVVPAVNNVLDGIGGAYIWARLAVLIFGLLAYVGGFFLSVRSSVKNFEKLSL